MTTMTVTSGTCAYCQHDGDVIPASLQPGTDRFMCADGKTCARRQGREAPAAVPFSPMTRGHIAACPDCTERPDGTARLCGSAVRIEGAARDGGGARTRAEDAYAHLASFQRGDVVDVAADSWHASATVVEAQRDGWNLEAAYLVAEGPDVSRAVTVRDLTHGRVTITARAGNVRYFDEAGYAAQNS